SLSAARRASRAASCASLSALFCSGVRVFCFLVSRRRWGRVPLYGRGPRLSSSGLACRHPGSAGDEDVLVQLWPGALAESSHQSLLTSPTIEDGEQRGEHPLRQVVQTVCSASRPL